ncbi:hypothetical protein [Microcoleus sp. S13_C3]|uniref:hypothetical protein n=1 Tax=Microcoleus sp. S13_C3 TaxID=3055409 RepID=UPI002FD1A436
MPVPQENSSLVEQASCLLSENGATSQFIQTLVRWARKPAQQLNFPATPLKITHG